MACLISRTILIRSGLSRKQNKMFYELEKLASSSSWVWIFSGESELIAAENIGLSACIYSDDGNDSPREIEDVFSNREIAIPFSIHSVDWAVRLARYLSEYPCYLVDMKDAENFVDYVSKIPPKDLGGEHREMEIKKKIWAEIKKSGKYYPGWEYLGRFERMQRHYLEGIRKEGFGDFESMKNDLRRAIFAMFDGLCLDHMAPQAAKAAASIQYMIEELLKIEKTGYLQGKSNGD